MTISTLQNSIPAAGNGSTYTFSFPFVADAAEYISVTYTDEKNVITLLSPSAYTLSINAATQGSIWGIGGTVTYPLAGNPIAAGTFLTISRILPLQQLTSLEDTGNFYEETVEAALDTLEMQIQQLSGRTTQYRGIWITNTVYNYGDIVQDGSNGNNTGNYYICSIANTSGVWATDLANGDWALSAVATPPTITLPLVVGQGGTGATTAAAAVTNLGAASISGNNSFSGTNSFSSSPTVPTPSQGDYSTKTIDSQYFTQNIPGGFVNLFLNAGMAVQQMGATGTISAGTPTYAGDGWIIGATGANATFAFAGLPGGYGFAHHITGNTGMTDIFFRQRIESSIAARAGNQTVTVQYYINNSTGSTITPTITVRCPTALDNYASTAAVVNAANMPPLPDGGWTLIAYSLSVGGAATYNGMEITIDFGAALNANTKSIYIGQPDVRITPNVSAGINLSPPSAEVRPITVELPACQRYFASTFGNGVMPAQNSGLSGSLGYSSYNNSFAFIYQWDFPVQMRLATPTIVTYNPSASNANWRDVTGSADITVAVNASSSKGANGVTVGGTSSPTAGHLIYIHATADARL